MAQVNEQIGVFNVDVVEENCSQTLSVSEIYKFLFVYGLPPNIRLELGYPVEVTKFPKMAVIFKKKSLIPKPDITTVDLRVERKERCLRCRCSFLVKNVNEYVTTENCHYHLNKVNFDNTFACCQKSTKSRGCAFSRLHVWSGTCEGLNGPFLDYVRMPVPNYQITENENYGIFAIKCQMCYTKAGMEAIEVALVNVDGREVYRTAVKPDNEVIDYNSQYSGITRKMFTRRKTKSLKDVQIELMNHINSYSYIIGHGVENDLRALKILHENIIDTSMIFPEDVRLPYRRRSLKDLSENILKRPLEITGCKSFNNAKTAMDLILWKIKSKSNV